jgi:hypothetical protein
MSAGQFVQALSGYGFNHVLCPAGSVTTGGGFSIGSGTITGWSVAYSGAYSSTAGNGWQAVVYNGSTRDLTLYVFAECLTLS